MNFYDELKSEQAKTRAKIEQLPEGKFRDMALKNCEEVLPAELDDVLRKLFDGFGPVTK